jgi:uncharacterized membrane protein
VLFGNLAAIAGAFIYAPNLLILLCGCAIMFLDWYLQFVKLFESNNIRRVITGVIGGYSLTAVYILGIKYVAELLMTK